jgi:hypothetical protein
MPAISCRFIAVVLALTLAAAPAAAQIVCQVTAHVGCFTDYIQSRRCYPVGPIDVTSQVIATACPPPLHGMQSSLIHMSTGGVRRVLLPPVLQAPGRRVRPPTPLPAASPCERARCAFIFAARSQATAADSAGNAFAGRISIPARSALVSLTNRCPSSLSCRTRACRHVTPCQVLLHEMPLR